MTHKEYVNRIGAATDELKIFGWTQREIEAALDGLDRDSAVECAEQFVAQLKQPIACA